MSLTGQSRRFEHAETSSAPPPGADLSGSEQNFGTCQKATSRDPAMNSGCTSLARGAGEPIHCCCVRCRIPAQRTALMATPRQDRIERRSLAVGIRRRDFIALLGGAVVTWPLMAGAQQQAMPIVGYLSARSPEDTADILAAFRRGLSETGYVERQNVIVEYRWALGDYERLTALAAHSDHFHNRFRSSPGRTCHQLQPPGWKHHGHKHLDYHLRSQASWPLA